MLNNLPDSIFIKDISGKYVIANDRFSTMLKMPNVEELLGKSDADIYDAKTAKKYAEEDNLIISGAQPELKREQRSKT
ncbi:MAG TPA: hypothetical protein DDX98_16145, partial [Bacteroidales bacterium]|nr:hypothetical protein [Bacteroidales bacterium]